MEGGKNSPMHCAKSPRQRYPSFARLSKFDWTSSHASTPFLFLLLLLMNLSPRNAFCAPDFVLSSCAFCRRRALAARAESIPPPTDGEVDVDRIRDACPWPHENRLSSALSSCENCLALATASAFSSCENCRILLDELRRIVDDRDRLAGVAAPLGSDKAPLPLLFASRISAMVAGSTLRRIMVSSSWRSIVTSTNSSESVVLPGEAPPPKMKPLEGTLSEPHRRSCSTGAVIAPPRISLQTKLYFSCKGQMLL